MYRVYIVDRSCVYWLRRWVSEYALLSTKRDHAMAFKRFNDAMEQAKRLKEAGNDVHIETDRRA